MSRYFVIGVLALFGCAEDSSDLRAHDGGGITGGSGGSLASGGTGWVSGGSGGQGTGATGGVPTPLGLSRIGDTFEIPTIAASAPKRFVDVAYDPAHDVYLVVTGNNTTSGSFVNADGQSLAAPFAIAQTSAYTQGSRVAYGKAADGFLAAWHDTRNDPNVPQVYGRIVRWDGSAPAFAGPDFKLSDGSAYQESGPAIGYSETSQTFLVAWHGLKLPNDDLHARLVSASGALIGSEIAVTNDSAWETDASIAWNPVLDEFLLAYATADQTAGAGVGFVRVKASDGTILGTPVALAQAAGTWLTQAAFVPAIGKYVVGWYEGKVMTRRVNPDGTLDGDSFVLASGYGSYDGFALAFQPVLGHIGAVFHGPTDEDWACAFDPDGTQTTPFEATSSAGTDGHFNPRIAAHSSRGEWLMVTSLGFTTVVGQRLGQ